MTGVQTCALPISEASLAFGEALELLDHALPHVREPLTRARLLAYMGRLLWMDGKTAAAEEVLVDGIAGLDGFGEDVEAARARLILGRCRWEQSRPDLAYEETEHARRVLEEHGPSADLALAYIRLAGLYKFEFDNEHSIEMAEKAVEVASAAGSRSARVDTGAICRAPCIPKL